MIGKILKATIVCSMCLILLGALYGAAYSQEYLGPNNTMKFAAGNWMAHGTTLTGPNLSEFQIPGLSPDATVDFRWRVCEDRCWSDAHCVAWTYEGAAITQSSRCSLKGGPFPDQAKNPSATSGAIGEPNTNREGNDYKHQAAVNAQECIEECGTDPKCMAWTFVAHGAPPPESSGLGICELKDGIPATREKKGSTSGYFVTR